MKPNSVMKEYVRVMHSLDIDDAAKQQIIRYCAKHSTLNKIRLGKFKIIVVKKDHTADEI